MNYKVRKLKQGEGIPTSKPGHRRIAHGGEWVVIDDFGIVQIDDGVAEVYDLKSAALSQMSWLNTL